MQLHTRGINVLHIKENAEKYNIDPERVFAVGFSAGGHLCGTLATKYMVAEEILGKEKACKRMLDLANSL